MSQLRDRENGCEWDKQQTFKSIAPFTIEEAYEVVDAIDREDITDLKEELGDLLLQVVFLSQIADEDNLFSFDDVAEAISNKLIRRHPYVFSNQQSHTPEDQMNQWEEIKQNERSLKKQEGTLDGIANNLPALKRSQKIQDRASKVGFDWPDTEGIISKIKEETKEIEDAIKLNDTNLIKEEIGDLLMIVTNLAQKLNIDSEGALKDSSNKFIDRFRYIENELKKMDKEISKVSFQELDSLWDESKKLR
jgi:MazG family protein